MIIPINQRFQIGQIRPTLVSTLRKCDNSILFHENYDARHPLGSYNLSLDKICKRANVLLDVLDNLKRETINDDFKSPQYQPLLEATDHLLDALMEHLDDCNGIHRSFFADSESRQFKKSHSILKRGLEPYRAHIGNIVNYLKHNQGNLRFLVFYWPGMMVPGYYIEGPMSGGGLGPTKSIHSDGNSGFSFYRDLPFHICSIFAISNVLSERLHNINPGLEHLSEKDYPQDSHSEWHNLFSRTAALPKFYFPDEIYKPQPEVLLSDSEASLLFPHNPVAAQPIPNGARITSVMAGDGVTRTFKLPYWTPTGA